MIPEDPALLHRERTRIHGLPPCAAATEKSGCMPQPGFFPV